MSVLQKTKYKDIFMQEDEEGKELYYVFDQSLPPGDYKFGGFSITEAKQKRKQSSADKAVINLWKFVYDLKNAQRVKYETHYELPSEINKIIGRNLKTFREFLGLTVREFAQLTKMHASQVSMIETGNRQLSVNNLITISNTFHVKLERILSGFSGGEDEK